MWDLIVSVPDHCLSFYVVWQVLTHHPVSANIVFTVLFIF